jgi:hypothetical protein
MRATSVSSTRAALLKWRFRFALFTDSKCLREECARSTLPRAVILNRFATDLRVLLRAIGFGIRRQDSRPLGFHNRLLLSAQLFCVNVRRCA